MLIEEYTNILPTFTPEQADSGAEEEEKGVLTGRLMQTTAYQHTHYDTLHKTAGHFEKISGTRKIVRLRRFSMKERAWQRNGGSKVGHNNKQANVPYGGCTERGGG